MMTEPCVEVESLFSKKELANGITPSAASRAELPVGSNRPKPRFVFIDLLRAIACLGVMWFHFTMYYGLHSTLEKTFPAWYFTLCETLCIRVPIFFVLSGFVIAHSLRNYAGSLG